MKKLLLLAMLLPTIVFGRKFYVSGSGSDSYTITQAQNSTTPWATLSKVQSSLGSFTSGDSILFAKGGSFTGTLTIQSKTGLYFGAWGIGADPLFWGTGTTIGSLVTLRGCTNITFYSLTFSDVTIPVSDRTVQANIQIVFTIESSSTGTVIRKCTMDRIGYGVYITSSSRGQTIDSCDIGNLRMIRNTPTSVNPDDDYGGVPVQISSRNNVFTNNYLHDCYSVSYDYGRDGGGVEFFEEGDTIMNNIVMYNTFYDCNGTFEFGSNSDGVANNPQINNIIAYNKVINSTTVVYINNNGQYKTQVGNLQFYNNLLLQTVPNPNPDGSSGVMFSMAIADATAGIIVLKNNIIQVSNGKALTFSGQFSGSNLTHTNNIYRLSGGSVTNFTLDATERGTAGTLWVDTTNINPLYWNYNLRAATYAIGNGVSVGLTRDFAGNPVTGTPSIGIYQYNNSSACTSYSYGAWTTCTNGTQTRTYTGLPSGCTGTAPTDSITRSCTIPTCTFTYGQWGTCVNSIQIRTYTKSPAGCISLPPADSIQRSCANVCSFVYSSWTTCNRGVQTRTYTKQPVNCLGVPTIDSVQRACGTAVVSSLYYRASRNAIYVKSTRSGSLFVTNLLGQTVLAATYPSGGKWVSVSSLSPGAYIASTYDKAITFSR